MLLKIHEGQAPTGVATELAIFYSRTTSNLIICIPGQHPVFFMVPDLSRLIVDEGATPAGQLLTEQIIYRLLAVGHRPERVHDFTQPPGEPTHGPTAKLAAES